MWTAFVFLCLCAFAQAQNRGGLGFQPSTTKPGLAQTITPTPVITASTAGYTIIPVTKYIEPEPIFYACKEKNERYPLTEFCNKYVECVDGIGKEKTCPDGLVYNPELNFSAYPCVHPDQYQCLETSEGSALPQAPNSGRLLGLHLSTTELSPTSTFGFAQTITPTPVLKASTAGHTIITVTKHIEPEPLIYVCREKNERYPLTGFCDKYVECVDGVGEEKTCPDGLVYNPDLNFTAYPCVYPNQYQCLETSALH